MARVLLIMPRLPQRLGAPYLGQQAIAAALLARGHEVRCLDLAASRLELDDRGAVAFAEAFAPDVMGLTLFTNNAARGYALARQLRPVARWIVAGGPHPTVCPGEPLAHGIDVSVAGEGELVLPAIVDGLMSGRPLPSLPGVSTRDDAGTCAEAIADLDGLAWPLHAYGCYDPSWYSADGRTVVPGGLCTSRGCPARCTFCANYVTGRAYRFRSAASVVAEMRALHDQYGVMHFPFWDDAFTALRPRQNALCDAILAEPSLKNATWTCITPGNMVKPFDLERMRKAGCVAVNFGIESGDLDILRVIQKGQRPEHVRAAVQAAKQAGMTTVVNIMFGFPEEGPDSLQRTMDLMADLAPWVDYYNNRGVLVPFPGTTIYDRWHAHYGFTGWWLDVARVPEEPNPFTQPQDEVQRLLEIDPTLDQDFFRYSDAVRDLIAAGVRWKARHNQATIARMIASYTSPAPP